MNQKSKKKLFLQVFFRFARSNKGLRNLITRKNNDK